MTSEVWIVAPSPLLTSAAERPLYICPSQKTWASPSMWVKTEPWKTNDRCSLDACSILRPGNLAFSRSSPRANSSPLCTMLVTGFAPAIALEPDQGMTREQETLTPSRIREAACLRFSGVIRFSVPSVSLSPQRPQLLRVSK